jgi:hypothetical protein
VRAQKSDDENLIFEAELRELGQSEFTLNSDLPGGDPDPLNYEGVPLRDAEQVLPFGSRFRRCVISLLSHEY